MAILSRDEYFASLHDRLGSDSSEEGIKFLEDMTDTYNDMESRVNGDGVDWEQRYHELDESWKARYQHRFFNGGDRSVPNGTFSAGGCEEDEDEYNPDDVKVDDLFQKN